MLTAWILLSPLLLGLNAFMIHNSARSLCLEDSAATGQVLLKRCDLDSESQQWVWMDRGMLMCVSSSRCLSAVQREPVRTEACRGPGVDAAGLMWDCDRSRLISRNTSMLLSVDGPRLILTHDDKLSKWKSVDMGDICQEKLRSRRASNEPEEFEAAKEKTGEQDTLTPEQKEYLRWFYRTEDPTTWKFVLLGLAFVSLLVGVLLLVVGTMANKNRKEIAKYKAAAAMAQRSEGEELLVISSSSMSPSPNTSPLQGHKSAPSNGQLGELRAGNIVVTWKDGNTSCLYPDPAAAAAAEEEVEEKVEEKVEERVEEVQEEVQEEEQVEVSAAEPEADEAAKASE